jgi:hypothetical protein
VNFVLILIDSAKCNSLFCSYATENVYIFNDKFFFSKSDLFSHPSKNFYRPNFTLPPTRSIYGIFFRLSPGCFIQITQMWIQRFSFLKTPSTHNTLKCSKEGNFGSLGQNVAQIHTISFAICQRVTQIPRPDTACTIDTVRQGAVFCSRYNCRLSG